MAILVDSSIWIAADRRGSLEHRHLAELIRHDKEEIVVCQVIQVEVCQGARTHEEFHLLWEAFAGFRKLPIEAEHWHESARNYFLARRKGHTFSTIDVLIATLAHSYGTLLWSKDRDFKTLSKHIAFEFYQAD